MRCSRCSHEPSRRGRKEVEQDFFNAINYVTPSPMIANQYEVSYQYIFSPEDSPCQNTLDDGYVVCCDSAGCSTYSRANRDPFWPAFAKPRWLCCRELYCKLHIYPHNTMYHTPKAR